MEGKEEKGGEGGMKDPIVRYRLVKDIDYDDLLGEKGRVGGERRGRRWEGREEEVEEEDEGEWLEEVGVGIRVTTNAMTRFVYTAHLKNLSPMSVYEVSAGDGGEGGWNGMSKRFLIRTLPPAFDEVFILFHSLQFFFFITIIIPFFFFFFFFPHQTLLHTTTGKI